MGLDNSTTAYAVKRSFSRCRYWGHIPGAPKTSRGNWVDTEGPLWSSTRPLELAVKTITGNLRGKWFLSSRSKLHIVLSCIYNTYCDTVYSTTTSTLNLKLHYSPKSHRQSTTLSATTHQSPSRDSNIHSITTAPPNNSLRHQGHRIQAISTSSSGTERAICSKYEAIKHGDHATIRRTG